MDKNLEILKMNEVTYIVNNLINVKTEKQLNSFQYLF